MRRYRSAGHSRALRTRIALLSLLALGTAGCGAPYVLRAAYEEARILWRREPIERILERDDLEPSRREKLELVLRARVFARERLDFSIGESYATFARVDDDAVVHVVTAAYRDRLEAYSWRYPIVGRVPYRGFFSQSSADAFAAELERDGYDTAVWPSVAFSTLGWFADPLLSSTMDLDAVGLVEVVFHELTHAQIYLASAAEFNESFANFVGHRAAIEFFCDDGDERRCGEAKAAWHTELVYGEVLESVSKRLGLLYAEASSLEPEALGVRRSQILREASSRLASRLPEPSDHVVLDLSEQNNAVLIQRLLYRRSLAQFERAWKLADRDLGRAVRSLIEAARDADDPFEALRHLGRDAGFSPQAQPRAVKQALATRCS